MPPQWHTLQHGPVHSFAILILAGRDIKGYVRSDVDVLAE